MPHRDLQRLLDQIDAVEADARQLVSGLNDDQGNWQPGDGAGWSIAQCLDHLARINDFYLAPFLQATQAAYAGQRHLFTGVRPTWFGRKWAAMLEPPVMRRMRAPSPAQPQATRRLGDVLESYVESHALYREIVEIAPAVDVNRIRVANPFFKVIRVRVATALLVVPAHDRRHLWQARNVMRAPGFPAA